MDSSFVKIPVNVPKLSGFDKSHQNLLTTKCGTITPILIDELIPGSKVNLKLALSASLPPLASDTFMRCSVKVESFFVPMRLLCGSFESWFTDQEKRFADYTVGGTSFSPTARKGFLPVLSFSDSADGGTLAAQVAAPGSLGDFLGCKSFGILSLQPISLMPFIAYHKVYSDWYRNSLVQNECFLPPDVTSSSSVSPASNVYFIGNSPYLFFSDSPYSYIYTKAEKLELADGVSVLALRQRNFGLDYFTSAQPSPQQGAAQTVTFNTSGATGQFSIAALRAANSMQQFKERNSISGNIYVEQLYARYGVRPSDGIAQRSLYLGGADFEVYSKGIYENASSSGSSNNPFTGQVGAQFGSAHASGSQFICSFEAKEPGYLLVNATLVPRVTYSTGIHRRLRHFIGAGSIADLANPILQNVGPQPIYKYELDGVDSHSTGEVFAYSDRYAEYKTMEDELHSILRDGNSLASFALQRSFAVNGDPELNTSFLQIPTSFMDQVTNVTSNISTYGCWIDTYFDYKVAQPLAKYSLPTLQDPAYEHGKTLMINRGGFKL